MSKQSNAAPLPTYSDIEKLPEQWDLYKKLVSGVPEGIAVKDFLLGDHWVLVEAESGFGMGLNVHGGSGPFRLNNSIVGMELRDLAALSTSWNFQEASVGVAALNAWYSTPENAEAAGMKIEAKGINDAFDLYQELCCGKKVTIVGHFPLIERLADECELTILERDPHGDDVPDPGCEYIIPYQDYTFMTGITLTNKTMPRLLSLAKQGKSSVILVGPSVVPSPILYDYGVDCMAGSVVADPERARAAIAHAEHSGIFKCGVQKMRIERPGWLD